MKTPSCSVVVCTRNRSEQLDRCLHAIANAGYPDLDLVVVDNGDEDSATREIAERWKARYLREPVVGVSRARNRGARSCMSEIVAFTDDDAIPGPSWLPSLVSEFSDPAVIAVTGRIEPLNGLTGLSASTYKRLGQYACRRNERQVFDDTTPDWFALANFGGIGDGANMAFRRRAFDIWPGFDVRLGLGGAVAGSDEHNAFFELIRRGHRIVFTPGAIVYHPFPTTQEEARDRSFRNLKAVLVYMALLFIEQPRYRTSLAGFIFRAVVRRVRQHWPFRNHTEVPAPVAAVSRVIKTIE
jgi:cellulose synthase/poly-beta-1,6-N-acetylglucosamine synthase-like glycosyltransferase